MSGGVEEDIHPHCLGCIKYRKCNVRPEQGVSCEIVPCDLDCGLKFHACKKKEHRLLCPNEKVPCYNVESGCPCFMQRKDLPKHLITCPASVIHCTMEWNRWYIDPKSEEKLRRCRSATQFEQPQLDVDLALRDQRMLRKWYTSNKNAQKTLQNHFKENPPQLNVEKGVKSVSSLDENINTEALSTGFDSQGSASSEFQTNVSSQLSPAHDYYKSGFLSSVISDKMSDVTVVLEELSKFIGIDEENKENLIKRLTKYDHFGELHERHLSTNCDSCDKHGKNDHMSCCDKSGKINLERVLRIKDDTDLIDFDTNMVTAIVSFPTRYLGLGPKFEASGYLPKNTMYTFLCCQEFRRDEYPWHCKNVHNEIHGGLNGWLQERCPLAQYGCTFSRQRLHPMPKNSKIVFNEILESFGIAPVPFNRASLYNGDDSSLCNKVPNHRGINITQLPIEVLQHIARFLDSFSLSNLALTSSVMREVCQSLLVERGIVALHWERQKKNNGFVWKATHKRWFYSSHFTPVKEWIFDDDCSMSNHLQSCLYFNKNKKTEPYYYPMGVAPSNQTYQKLKMKMLDTSCFENITTKL